MENLKQFVNKSKKGYPKTLHIRNDDEKGEIWQVYHVNNKIEAAFIIKGAWLDHFYYVTMVDKTEEEETSPNWRDEILL